MTAYEYMLMSICQAHFSGSNLLTLAVLWWIIRNALKSRHPQRETKRHMQYIQESLISGPRTIIN